MVAAAALLALVAVACRPFPSDARVADRFERADSATLGTAQTGEAWTDLAGTWGVSQGAARPAATGYSLSVLDAGDPDGRASLVVSALGPEYWLVVRATDGSNYWRFGRTASGPYQLQQVRDGALGTPVVTQAATVTPAAGDRLTCRMTPLSLTCSVNDTTVASTLDRFNGTATRVGVAAASSGTSTVRLDDLAVQDLEVGPDLAVTDVVDDDPVVAGGQLRWTVTVGNVGTVPSATSGVVVSVPGEAPVTAVPATGTCDVTELVVCQLGALAPGQDTTVEITSTAPPGAGSVDLTARTVVGGDPEPSNDQVVETTTAIPAGARAYDGFDRADAASLGVTPTGQTWSTPSGSWGVQSATAVPTSGGYSLGLLAAGSGDGTVTATVVEPGPELWMVLRGTDPSNYWRFGRWESGPYQLQQVVGGQLGSPAVTTFGSVFPAAGDQLGCRFIGAGITCSVDGVPVTQASGAAQGAGLVGLASGAPSGSTPLAFDDLLVVDEIAAPDVAVALTDTDPVATGGELAWEATVFSVGEQQADDVELDLALPPTATGFQATSDHGTCAGGPTVTCDLGSLAPGETATVVATAVAPATPGVLQTSAVVRAPGDGRPSNDSASVTTTVYAAVPPGTPIDDGFARVGDTLGVADSGHPWTVASGSFTTDGAAARAGTESLSLARIEGGYPYGTFDLTVDDVGDERFWAVFRVVDSLNYFRVGPDGEGVYRLQKVVNGVAQGTQFLTQRSEIQAADGDVIRIVNRPDDGIFVSVNGQHLLDAGDQTSLDVPRFGFATLSTSVRVGAASVSPVMSTGATVVDTFSRPDSDVVGPPEQGVDYRWQGNLSVRDQQLTYTGSFFGVGFLDSSSEAADISVRVPDVSDEFSLVFRYAEDGTFYRFGRRQAGGGYEVDLIDGIISSPPPVPVQVLSTPTPADGDVLEVRQSPDGHVLALVNGVPVLQFTDQVTNLRSTYAGVSSDGSGARFDDFTVVPE